MAQVAQPISLLASVRAQLSSESDSESSASGPPQSSTSTHQVACHKPSHSIEKSQSISEVHATESTQACDGSTTTECIANVNTGTHSTNDNPEFIPMHRPLIENTFPNESTSRFNILTDVEPFPEYDELSSPSYDADEQAYKAAFAAAMQEEIRAREVDPFIETCPDQPENKRQALEDMKNALADPELRGGTRQRFVALTNMIIRLDFILFRRSTTFLNPTDTADAQLIANVLLGYVAWADGMVKELLDRTVPINYILGELSREDVSEVIRHRRMACVVTAHLKKPRAPEQRLLSYFCNLYDQWVHDDFLTLRNHQIFVEEGLVMDRLHLTRFLHAVWDILSRLIENYACYRYELNAIKEKFFTSASGLSDGTIESFAEDLSVAE